MAAPLCKEVLSILNLFIPSTSPPERQRSLQLPKPGSRQDISNSITRRPSFRNTPPLEVRQRLIHTPHTRKRSRTPKSIRHATPPNVIRTLRVSTRIRSREDISITLNRTRLDRSSGVLESIPFSENSCSTADFKVVAGVIVEVVVDGVEESVSRDFRRAAGGGVDVIVLECYEVCGTGEV